MIETGLDTRLVDEAVYGRAVDRFRNEGIVVPTFGELADPGKIPAGVRRALPAIDPDEPHPFNLFRVHWYNDDSRTGMLDTPGYLEVPPQLTDVEARILVAIGERFPMIRAHKVLAALGCLVPRIVTGQFDPAAHRAVWPSTGNYCRGGVAISRIMDCRGVAVLPEGMSRERFDWLEHWVLDPQDIIRTLGTESNVKEIYDKCNELERNPENVILNQFSEFGNHLVHYLCTGRALGQMFEAAKAVDPDLQLRAFVSASGSAGTLGAGHYLKERYGSMIVAVEALECPTMLCNGFGEHNIQGIGDKHIPLIHNVMDTDVATAVSDVATDQLLTLFNTDVGREHLRARGVPDEFVAALSSLGISSICNVLAAMKVAKHYGFGRKDVLVTVATDGAAMYGSEVSRLLRRHFPAGFGPASAAEVFGRHLLGVSTDHVLELTRRERLRIFNLGYYTWVEQRGVSVRDFESRRDPSFWVGLHECLPLWDRAIEEFNAATGALDRL